MKVERIDGQLHSIREIVDGSGKTIQRLVTPLMVEFKAGDLAQIVIGSMVLAIPVSVTEEVWNLGEELSWFRIGMIALCSIVITGLFVYVQFYRGHLREHRVEYAKRVFATYVATLAVAGLLLWLFDKHDLLNAPVVTAKRAIIVAFPATFSATIVDSLK